MHRAAQYAHRRAQQNNLRLQKGPPPHCRQPQLRLGPCSSPPTLRSTTSFSRDCAPSTWKTPYVDQTILPFFLFPLVVFLTVRLQRPPSGLRPPSQYQSTMTATATAPAMGLQEITDSQSNARAQMPPSPHGVKRVLNGNRTSCRRPRGLGESGLPLTRLPSSFTTRAKAQDAGGEGGRAHQRHQDIIHTDDGIRPRATERRRQGLLDSEPCDHQRMSASRRKVDPPPNKTLFAAETDLRHPRRLTIPEPPTTALGNQFFTNPRPRKSSPRLQPPPGHSDELQSLRQQPTKSQHAPPPSDGNGEPRARGRGTGATAQWYETLTFSRRRYKAPAQEAARVDFF